MSRFLKLIFFLFFAAVSLSAKPVSQEKIEKVAQNWFFLKSGKQYAVAKTLKPMRSISTKKEFVRIVSLNPKGWVAVSTDDIAKPILAYGESSLDLSSLPQGFNDWMTVAQKEIENAINTNQNGTVNRAISSKALAKKREIEQEWKDLSTEPGAMSADASSSMTAELDDGKAVTPLLWMGSGNEEGGITWNQSPYYNALCPADSHDPSGHTFVGCVATAMSQIMRYYQWPKQGTGFHSYTLPNYGTLSADFGSTTYQWSQMPYNLTIYSSAEKVEAVATLCYQAGVSVDMKYNGGSDGGSEADPEKVPAAFTKYFGYTKSQFYERNSTSDWDGLILSELSAKRPLFYVGARADGSTGHAFILDGYDGSGYYHFNWGWGGRANGYFSLDNLTPNGYNFSGIEALATVISPSEPPPPPSPPPSSNDRKSDITKLYIAYFLRAPRYSELNFWIETPLSVEQISNSLWVQNETRTKYPRDMSIGDLINTAFLKAYNRYPLNVDFNYLVETISNGKMTPSYFICALIKNANETDAKILENKARVAIYFADSQIDDYYFAINVMENVDETEESVQNAINMINSH